MEEKIILESNNDYAEKLKKLSTVIVLASVLVFLVLMEFFNSNEYTAIAVLDIVFLVVSICLLIFSVTIQNVKITVSDKRVYGIAMFGKRVDLPLDSVSAVGISSFKGISVGTSSGRIMFKGIGNRDEIYDVISKLLVERQNKVKNVMPNTPIEREIPQSNADELKKYKELLDDGVITQEEFDAKKKQLLGL